MNLKIADVGEVIKENGARIRVGTGSNVLTFDPRINPTWPKSLTPVTFDQETPRQLWPVPFSTAATRLNACYTLVTTAIRVRFDGHSTACRRFVEPLAAVTIFN